MKKKKTLGGYLVINPDEDDLKIMKELERKLRLEKKAKGTKYQPKKETR